MKNSNLLLFYIVLCISGKCFAQDSTKIDDYYIDFSVPDIGAFTLLGTKPEQTTNPGNVKEFSASVLNIVKSGSKIAPGIAIDWAPYQTFGKKSFHLADYKKHYLWRGLQTTLGTVADSTGTRIGFGLKWTFIDKSDPLLDVAYAKLLNELHHDIFVTVARQEKQFLNERQAFLKALELSRNLPEMTVWANENVLELMDSQDSILLAKDINLMVQDIKDAINSVFTAGGVAPLTANELERIIELCLQMKEINRLDIELDEKSIKSFQKAKLEWKRNNWNKMVVTAGSGWVLLAADDKWKSLRSQLFKTYLNAKFPIGKVAQVTGFTSYASLPKSNLTDSTLRSQFFIGGRFLIGNADNRFSIDAGYQATRAQDASYDQKNLALNLGFEFKITDGIYLEIACGVQGRPSKLFDSGSILSLGSLKYALNKSRRFDVQ